MRANRRSFQQDGNYQNQYTSQMRMNLVEMNGVKKKKNVEIFQRDGRGNILKTR